ncbi:MAG TPA: fumarylacetoacetate hydrolase family protein [Actinomycetota bacterium]|nr:fumarylacetoacetate hydrolase family protein [Actinomycetota bacterium]
MRVSTVEAAGRTVWGRVEDARVVDATGLAPSLREFLGDGGDAGALAVWDGRTVDLDSSRFLPPIPDPSKIWCVGLNFEDYRRMLGLAHLKAPNIFLKAPSALVGHDAEVGVPVGYGTVFHEWELTAVVGQRLSSATPEQAKEAIFGYTILDDLVFHEIELVNRDHQQWAKNVDGFAPCGPWVVTRDEVEPAGGLAMVRRRNGRVEAKSSTAEMRLHHPDLLSFISTFSTLEPGDLVTGGTPPAGPCAAGDVIEGEIEGIGTLRVRLVERRVDPRWQVVLEDWRER